MIKEQNEVCRVNISMSSVLKEWYQQQSSKMGVSMSGLMMFTLNQAMINELALVELPKLISYAEKNK